jgi:hypothetical protein
MFSSLDRADMIVADLGGRRHCLQTDHRSAAEIQHQEELSTLFALTRVLSPIAMGTADEVTYVCAEPPPEFLRRAVASAGGTLQVHPGPVLTYEGSLGQPEELADGAFRRLAHRVLRERNTGLKESALEALEHAHAQAPDKEEDELGYWTRAAELAAVTGELLRAKFGGRWVTAPQVAAIPFAFRLGREDSARYILSNVAGKAEQFLQNGARDSPRDLLLSAEDQQNPVPEQRPMFFMLKAAEWPGRETMVCQSLVPWRDPRVAMPWLTYGEDLPNSFGHFSKDHLQAEQLDELHAQALESLKSVAVEALEMNTELLKLLVALGPFYAAEKVLDAGFMRGLHQRLGSSSLVAGIPRRGLLLVMNARVRPALLRVFAAICEAQYQRGESEPLCLTPLLIEDGKITGFVWVRPKGDAKLVTAAELNKGASGGFLSRLFSWARS